MKTKKFSKKLALKKTTIAHLNRNEMKNVYGADTTCKCPTWTFTCGSAPPAGCCKIP